MRNRYSKEFEDYVMKNAPKYNIDEFVKKINKKFNCDITIKQLRCFLSHRGSIVRCKDYNVIKNTCSGFKIGTEVVKSDGMTKIKTENGWKYKQRYIWEQHYGEIPKNHFIIFLDGNRNNFDINNLKCVSFREASLMANYKLYSKDKDCTETGLKLSQLIIKTRDKSGLKMKKSHHKKNAEREI